ncbi:MAG: DNA polymerase III subunit beta [Vampirovibrionales bacterium]|nr:DNA polymerase III subunit beta [Vampirovibrionales bacterium]
MKFTVQRDLFQQAIAAAQRATSSRPIQPILAHVLLQSQGDNQLKLSATDLDFALETTVEAEVSEPGQTTLSARKLADIMAKLPPGVAVSFQVDESAQTARIRCGSSSFELRTLPAADFPELKPIDQEQYLEVDGRALIRAINQTAFAAASYESNNVLGGVFFRLTAQSLEMAATDGSRLARSIEALSAPPALGESASVSAIIPVKALQEFVKLAGGSLEADEKVRLAISQGQISLRTPHLYVLSRLLDGQYPQYGQLIPQENKIVALANRQAFIASLERAAVMANERTNVVKLTFEGDHLSLAANTPDVGDASDAMNVTFENDEPLIIAFNYKFLLDALKVIESDDVRMETNGALAPTVFKSRDRDDYLCLVMPVQVK